MRPQRMEHIVSHCLPPELATRFPYFTLIPSPMPPKVEKEKHVHLNVLQKQELNRKLKERSSVVEICTVLPSNAQQLTFSNNVPLLPPFNPLTSSAWGHIHSSPKSNKLDPTLFFKSIRPNPKGVGLSLLDLGSVGLSLLDSGKVLD